MTKSNTKTVVVLEQAASWPAWRGGALEAWRQPLKMGGLPERSRRPCSTKRLLEAGRVREEGRGRKNGRSEDSRRKRAGDLCLGRRDSSPGCSGGRGWHVTLLQMAFGAN